MNNRQLKSTIVCWSQDNPEIAKREQMPTIAELMKQVRLVLTGDSFPMHLASALETPLIALFGPTDERRIGPLSHKAIVLRANKHCDRCYRRDHCERNCIGYITPEVVLDEVSKLLACPG